MRSPEARRIRPSCRQFADRLAAVEVLDEATQRHVDICLRCQAEMVAYRRLLRVLAELRSETLAAPPGIVDDVVDFVFDRADAVRTRRHRVRRVLAAGGVVALAGGAIAGAVVAVAFHRSGTDAGLAGAEVVANTGGVFARLRPAS